MDFKNIHIGSMISFRIAEVNMNIERICNFFECSVGEIEQVFKQESLSTDVLLKWCKLLKYDFFRIYSQHLILYSPPVEKIISEDGFGTKSPIFRKNIYTKEVIDFILTQIKKGEMTKREVMERYRIPKTTLYKWIAKYGK